MSLKDLTQRDRTLLKKSLSDFPLYAEKFLRIRTKDNKVIPFVLNKAQLYVHEIAERQLRETGRVRILLLKARQEGMSTYTEGRAYWKTTLTPNFQTVVIAHEMDASKNLFGMTERFYSQFPIDWLKPKQDSHVRGKTLSFNSKKDKNSLGSEFLVKCAKDPDSGRSLTINFMHASEIAFWRDARNQMLSLMQAMPDDGSEVWVETTANGFDEYFFHEWTKAENGIGGFIPIFIPWFWDAGYKKPFVSETQRGRFYNTLDTIPQYAGEKELIEKFKVKPQQLHWRRQTIDDKCGGDLRKFWQEYPSYPAQAFVSSGNSIFNKVKIDELQKQESKAAVLGRMEWADDMETQVRFVEDLHGMWTVYNHPVSGEMYHSGFDTSLGVEGGDFSAGLIINSNTEDCATFHGRVDPIIFAHEIKKGCVYYSRCIAVPEVNMHGLAVLIELKNIYDNIYIRKVDFDKNTAHQTNKLGWLTTEKSKGQIIAYTKDLIHNNSVTIHDKFCLQEMMTYIRFDNGVIGAEKGCYDDRVMARMICYFTFRYEGKIDIKTVYTNWTQDAIIDDIPDFTVPRFYRCWSFQFGYLACISCYMDDYGRWIFFNEYNFPEEDVMAAFSRVYEITNEAYSNVKIIDIGDPGKVLTEYEESDNVNIGVMESIERKFNIQFEKSKSNYNVRVSAVDEMLSRRSKGVPKILIHYKCKDLIAGFNGAYKVSKDGLDKDQVLKNQYAGIHNCVQNFCTAYEATKSNVIIPKNVKY